MRKGIDIFSLSGKTALVTGATGYLGSAMAIILAEAGARVLVNSRSHERCASLISNIRATGLLAEPAIFDVTSKESINNFFASYQNRPLHILINNAYAGGSGSIEMSSDRSYAASYEITLLAAHNLLQNALPCLRKAVEECSDASVINITSMYAMVSPDHRIYENAKAVNPPFYGAAKAGLLQWSRYAGCEFGHEGIRVNCISPGSFPSDSVQKDNPDFIKELSKKIPLGRIGAAEEIRGPVLFLASSASSYVNGANLVVDGGWTCW